MKLQQEKLKIMFDKDKYITKRISQELALETQLFIWTLINDARFNIKLDYLQIFDLHRNGNVQEIIHRQEVPPYEVKHLFLVDNPIDSKIYIIDDDTHSTMLLACEY